jgi:membrane-bound lytic murein transglycosylase MltF
MKKEQILPSFKLLNGIHRFCFIDLFKKKINIEKNVQHLPHFYDVIFGLVLKNLCREPQRVLQCSQKLSWVTKELNGFKNKTTTAAKKMKEPEQRCKVDDNIS